MNYLVATVCVTAILISPIQASDSNSKYVAMLEQAAANMNLVVTPLAKKCVERAVILIPESVKQKAAQIQSIDAGALANAGVPPEDVNRAVAVSRPCINQISMDQRPK